MKSIFTKLEIAKIERITQDVIRNTCMGHKPLRAKIMKDGILALKNALITGKE